MKRYQNESCTQRKRRLSKEREKRREKLMLETAEEKESRLAKRRKTNDVETEKETQHGESRIPLLRARESILQRRKQTYNQGVTGNETFHVTINTFCDKCCEICQKKCYPNQVVDCQLNFRRDYLPVELSSKTSLVVCHRCHSHIKSLKDHAPPKAYWNNMLPGDIPEEIAKLTEPEQRLLQRIIPYVKVIKFPGRFGQYGFKGHATLFALDIFEVSDKITEILPRSSLDTGMIVVTETLNNLNTSRNYAISPNRVYTALNWLIANNPLYKDVRVDMSVQLNTQDVIRVIPAQNRPTVDRDGPNTNLVISSSYTPINNVSRIVRASWNQGNEEVFRSGHAGHQCFAMVIANLLCSFVIPPKQWNTNILNQNMIAGDALYVVVDLETRNQPYAYPIDEYGYLEIRNIDVVKHDIKMFNNHFTIDYNEVNSLSGSLCDVENDGVNFLNLKDSINSLFLESNTGMLMVNGSSYGLINDDGKFYFTDSHSCGPKGKGGVPNGKACTIECDTIDELHRIVRRTVHFNPGSQFTIHIIRVDLNREIQITTPQVQNDDHSTHVTEQDCTDAQQKLLDKTCYVNDEKTDGLVEEEDIFMRTYENDESYERLPNRDNDIINTPPTCGKNENHFTIIGEVPEVANVGSPLCLQNNYTLLNDDHQPEPMSDLLFIPVQTSVMAPIDHEQPDINDAFNESKNINEIIRKTNDNIVNINRELKAEEFSWYYLFPNGINGLNEPRPVKITPLDYFQQRILGSDTRFQRTDYLFYALSMFEYHRVQSTINACGRSIQGQEGQVEDLHLHLKNLRGTASYWRTAHSELIAFIRCLGPPTWFLTLSCNDLNWIDMRKALLIADGRPHEDPSTITTDEAQRLIETYPVVLSRHFSRRVDAFLKLVKSNDNILGGKVTDFWLRVEFQNRGSPHVHLVIWIENAPSFETDEGLDYIDQVITCKLPSEDEDPELRNLVNRNQIHRHTHTCFKNQSRSCRFAFPRKPCGQTHVVPPSSDEFIRNGGRFCSLKRDVHEIWVNNYNQEILKIWNANMDIQPCGSNESIAHYIAKYISKTEPNYVEDGVAKAIQEIRRDETDISKKIFKSCMRILKERQVSASECVYRLCHLPLRTSSRKCVFLNTRKPEQRYKVLKFENNQAVGLCSNVFEKYMNRPRQQEQEFDFPNMCLLEFAMKFEPFYPKKNTIGEESVDADEELQVTRRRLINLTNNTKMIIRNVPAIVRVPHFQMQTDPENYYYSLLVQYVPYYSENELIDEYNSAREAFLAREDQLRQSNTLLETHRARDRQLEIAFNQAHAFNMFETHEDVFEVELVDDGIYQDQRMTDEQFQNVCSAMNLQQRQIITNLTQSIKDQMNGVPTRIKWFVTGGAGVGKTFTFNAMKEQVLRCYGKQVVKVGALTGVAARLVGGTTLHTLFKLPVEKDGKIVGNLAPLTGNYLKVLRNQWKDIEFLFIDEVSMVSYEMFSMIDSRLRQLKKNETQPFGNINIVVFGDLFQLPPIRGAQVFQQPIRFIPSTHLWRLFSLVELSENMRQQNDKTFADLLNALRVGKLNADHFKLLISKILIDFAGDFDLDKAIRIYPTRAQVDAHNLAVLERFRAKEGVHIFKIKALDTLVNSTRNADSVNMENIVSSDINKTGGLQSELEIFIGARVMLRSNIDIDKGLVNGAIGTIKEIVWPLFRRDQMYSTDIPSVHIDFGDIMTHLIKPKSIQFPALRNYGTIERTQLPIVLCWACTVHKMQGCTVDRAVVYLGPRLFAKGQAYVALSRVKSLDGLRIEELDCHKLTGKTPCNEDAMKEMERMKNLTPIEPLI